jgi:predicted MFS family arabinose efflux permease
MLLGRMWNVAPLATDRAPRSTAVRLAIGTFYSGLYLAVLIGAARKKCAADWTAWRPVFILIVGFTAVHALYWADMRMRSPLVPAIALLAAACFCSRIRTSRS